MFQVTNAVAEMSSSTEAKMWDDTINRRLFDLVHSPNTSEKLGGILAIGVSRCYPFGSRILINRSRLLAPYWRRNYRIEEEPVQVLSLCQVAASELRYESYAGSFQNPWENRRNWWCRVW